LLNGVIREAAAMGVRRATLEVRRSNLAALGLYEAAGFVVAAVRRQYYTQPVEDALLLARG
jgi:ribosomal-protein-alanine N-acetyltransferase